MELDNPVKLTSSLAKVLQYFCGHVEFETWAQLTGHLCLKTETGQAVGFSVHEKVLKLDDDNFRISSSTFHITNTEPDRNIETKIVDTGFFNSAESIKLQGNQKRSSPALQETSLSPTSEISVPFSHKCEGQLETTKREEAEDLELEQDIDSGLDLVDPIIRKRKLQAQSYQEDDARDYSNCCKAEGKGNASVSGDDLSKAELGLEKFKLGDDKSFSEDNTFAIVSDEEELDESRDYVSQREQNIINNKEFLAGLKFEEEKVFVGLKKYMPRGPNHFNRLKQQGKAPLPSRASLRQRQIDPEIILTESPLDERLPKCPVLLTKCTSRDDFGHGELGRLGCMTSDDDVKKFSSYLCNIDIDIGGIDQCNLKYDSQDIEYLEKKLDDISISKERVSKMVVPTAILSVGWHPSRTELLVAAGDITGNVGVWNATNSNTDKSDRSVVTFKPHFQSVPHIVFGTTHPHKLYTSSHDASIRCGNFEKGEFDEIFSMPYKDDDKFHNFEFIDEEKSLLVSHLSGFVSVVDTRTPRASAEQSYLVSSRSLSTVSIHPSSRSYFITACEDGNINLYDLRKLSDKNTPGALVAAVATSKAHLRPITSAYFSPDGHSVLSYAPREDILVSDVSKTMELSLSQRIQYSQDTNPGSVGVMPVWHPFVKDVFVTGSWHPRGLQIYSASGDNIKSLKDEKCPQAMYSVNAFHPYHECAIVGARGSTSSSIKWKLKGRLSVFVNF